MIDRADQCFLLMDGHRGLSYHDAQSMCSAEGWQSIRPKTNSPQPTRLIFMPTRPNQLAQIDLYKLTPHICQFAPTDSLHIIPTRPTSIPTRPTYFSLLWNLLSAKSTVSETITDYSQFAPKPARPPYQLPPPILPTRSTSTTNSPRVVCQLAPLIWQTRPNFYQQLLSRWMPPCLE